MNESSKINLHWEKQVLDQRPELHKMAKDFVKKNLWWEALLDNIGGFARHNLAWFLGRTEQWLSVGMLSCHIEVQCDNNGLGRSGSARTTRQQWTHTCSNPSLIMTVLWQEEVKAREDWSDTNFSSLTTSGRGPSSDWEGSLGILGQLKNRRSCERNAWIDTERLIHY